MRDCKGSRPWRRGILRKKTSLPAKAQGGRSKGQNCSESVETADPSEHNRAKREHQHRDAGNKNQRNENIQIAVKITGSILIERLKYIGLMGPMAHDRLPVALPNHHCRNKRDPSIYCGPNPPRISELFQFQDSSYAALPAAALPTAHYRSGLRKSQTWPALKTPAKPFAENTHNW